MSSRKTVKADKDAAVSEQQLIELIQDKSIPPGDRGDLLAFAMANRGLDYRSMLRDLVQHADLGRDFQQQRESEGENMIVPERFLGSWQQPEEQGHYAMVTRGPADACVPASEEQIEDLCFGDAIYLNPKTDRIVGRDGHLPPSGDVVTVKSLLPDDPQLVIVSHQEREVLARVPASFASGGPPCQPGRRVVYDPVKRFVLKVLEDKPTGEHLLADTSQMETVRRENVGSPKPVVDEIISRARRFIDHPTWMERMRARPRCSYSFVGGTGCGKSFHLKLIVTELHDLVEEVTGKRTSRVVMLDASNFWNSLFGSTEQRIAAWADQIQAIGSQPLFDRQGVAVRFPLFVILEEAEALLRNRGEEGGGSSHLFDRPLALLLQKTESLETAIDAPVFWLMSSNKPSLLDPAAQRRFGTRQVTFGPLRLNTARSVLATKIPEDLPICGSRNGSEGRDSLINTVLGYLYGPEPRQELAEVHLVNSKRRKLHRRELVTPAVLEEAVSSATDRCLEKSDRAGELLGLDAQDLIGFLAQHYTQLARTLRPHNVADHCPDWFREEPEHVANVIPLIQQSHTRAVLLD